MATLQTPMVAERLGRDSEQPLSASQNVHLPLRANGAGREHNFHAAFKIGGISFGMSSDGRVPLCLDPAVRPFAVSSGAASEKCDVNIHISLVDQLPVPKDQPLFHSGGLWSLFEERVKQPDGYRFNFQRSFPGETPYKSAWFDRDFKAGHVLLSRLFFHDDQPIYPLEYPLDEVLMIHRLARGQGLEVHAVGILDEAGRGHLFLGHSGAGKSTSARLWLKQPGIRILSDDRIVLRPQAEKIWMYGTPWHGDAGISSPQCAPVTNIYFLEQYGRNELLAISPGVAAAELFARSFVPRHCAEGLEFALGFIERIAHDIPCNIFRFVPELSAVEAIRHARD